MDLKTLNDTPPWEDIVEAVYEAMSMAGEFWGEGDDEDEDDEFLHS